jgi:hypothetical protein
MYVYAGANNDPILLQNLDFVAGQGSLSNGTNYKLLQHTWLNGKDVVTTIQTGVKPSANGKISFTNSVLVANNCNLEVQCDGAVTLAKDPTLSLMLSSSVKAKDAKTGKQLSGVGLNGSGAGQIQVYNYSQSGILYRFAVAKTGLNVAEIGNYYGGNPGTSVGASDITLELFNVYAKDVGQYVNQVVIGVASGSLGECANYKLWWNSNGVDCVLASGQVVGKTVVFNFQFHVAAGLLSRLEVHADVLATSANMGIQTTLKSVAGIDDNNKKSAVDYIHASQPLWSFYNYGNGGGGGGGMG